MTLTRVLATVLLSSGVASGALAQSAVPPTTPAGPAPVQAPKLRPPPVAPPPPASVAAAPAARRAPTPAALKAAAPGGPPVSTVRPDTSRKPNPTRAPLAAPAARVTAPPRPAPKVSQSAALISASVRPGSPPAGATMHCKDGTYLSGAPSANRCANNGGVSAIFPAARPAPKAPPGAVQKRP